MISFLALRNGERLGAGGIQEEILTAIVSHMTLCSPGKPTKHSMSDFGCTNPREMPAHLFYRSLRVDYDTAVRADVERQNCSICPRYWYVDAAFRCERCAAEFTFSAAEQRVWYEDYGFWIDSLPTHCMSCRRKLRELKAVRREYDESVAQVLQTGDLEAKKRLAGVIDQLYEIGGELPPRIHENRRQLANQIAKADQGAT